MMEILILGDSRIRDLKFRTDERARIRKISISGATLFQLQKVGSRIIKYLKPHSKVIVIVIAGICNYSTKYVTKDEKYCYYHGNTMNIQNMLASFLKTLKQQKQEDVQVNLCFATLPPSKLKPPHIHCWDMMNKMQVDMEQDIMYFNNMIKRWNIKQHLPTLQLHTTIMKKHKDKHNKKAYDYKKIYDGIHPEKELLYQWSKILNSVIKSILNYHYK